MRRRGACTKMPVLTIIFKIVSVCILISRVVVDLGRVDPDSDGGVDPDPRPLRKTGSVREAAKKMSFFSG